MDNGKFDGKGVINNSNQSCYPMTREGFIEFLRTEYPTEKSRAAASYVKAIEILDNIFLKSDFFDLKGKSLCILDDLELLLRISDFVRTEEAKFRENEEGFFALGSPNQKSYPKKRFCSAAVKSVINYYSECQMVSAQRVVDRTSSAKQLTKKLVKLFEINDTFGEEVVRETKTRIGQDFFRKMLLQNYKGKCSVTGLDVPEVLRASHIVAWKDDKANRMNPENGILLSATYDAAFDKHLISFDEDYRMIVSRAIKEHYTSDAANVYFISKEGLRLELPSIHSPNQDFLQKHREKLVG